MFLVALLEGQGGAALPLPVSSSSSSSSSSPVQGVEPRPVRQRAAEPPLGAQVEAGVGGDAVAAHTAAQAALLVAGSVCGETSK